MTGADKAGGRFPRVIFVLSLCRVQKRLQVINVLDGRSEGFHFAESFLQVLLWQMVSELGIAFVDTLHSLPLPLISFPDKGWPVGIVTPSVTWVRNWEGEGALVTVSVHNEGITGEGQQRHLFRVGGWYWGLRVQVESDHGVQIEGPGQWQLG